MKQSDHTHGSVRLNIKVRPVRVVGGNVYLLYSHCTEYIHVTAVERTIIAYRTTWLGLWRENTTFNREPTFYT